MPLARMLAALCYSLPLLPSLVVLARERRHKFLRFHAAQALAFSSAVALGQTLIYLLLMVAGGMIHDARLAIVAAVIVLVLFAALGLCALLLWFRLVGDCIDGHIRPLPVIGGWALRAARQASHPQPARPPSR